MTRQTVTHLATRLQEVAARHPDASYVALILPDHRADAPPCLITVATTETTPLASVPHPLAQQARETAAHLARAHNLARASLIALYERETGDVHLAVHRAVSLPERPPDHLAVPLPAAQCPLWWLDLGEVRKEKGTLHINQPPSAPLAQVIASLDPWLAHVATLLTHVPGLAPRTPQEEAVALTALAVRWSYLAALVDEPIPPWQNLGVLTPQIFDVEMKRLNIEISAALTDLLTRRKRNRKEYTRLLVAARLFLPVSVNTQRLIREPADERTVFEEDMASALRGVIWRPNRAVINMLTLWAWRNRDFLERLHSTGYTPARRGTRCLPPEETALLLADVARRLMLTLGASLADGALKALMAFPLLAGQVQGWATDMASAPLRLPGG